MRLLLLFLPLLLLPHSQQDEYTIITDNDWKRPDDYFKNWKCISNIPDRQWSNYRDLTNGGCADLKDSLNQCCVTFKNCDDNKGHFCVEDHEACNAKVISDREPECSSIADRLVQKELRHFPDKDWKCRPPINRLGGWEQDYRNLMRSDFCSHLKDSLNQCCLDFNTCNGVNCIADHKKCNAEAIRGLEQQCSAIADHLVQESKGHFIIQDNWKCTARLWGGAEYFYKTLVEGSCANLKDRLNQCCVTFKNCDDHSGHSCVEEHEKCNSNVISGRESECSEIADRLVRKDLRMTHDKDWKCQPPFGRLGGQDQDYRDLIRNIHCSHLKDRLNQCCVDFNNCTTAANCVENHEICNAKVVKGSEKECSAIANRLIAQEKRFFPEKDFKCTGNNIPGAREGIYHKIMNSIHCFPLKGKISDCCENFNTCSDSNGADCIIGHRTCNKQVVEGLEKECLAIVDSLVKKEETTPDDDIHNWKCKPPFGRLGGFEPDYHALINSPCSHLKDSLNQCCVEFNSCGGVNCVEKHEECNAKVISGKENQCLAITDKFIHKEQRHFPDKDWECKNPVGRWGGKDEDWRNLRRSLPCSRLKDGLNQCCKNFNKCKGRVCVEQHEECNAVVVKGLERQCSAIANKFVAQEERQRPDWKCTGNGIPGASFGIYHKIMNSTHCAHLKDKIGQCCANFNTCSDKKGTDCIIRHKICNEQVVKGFEKECSALVDSLVKKEDKQKEKEDEKSTNVVIIYYERVIMYSKDQLATHPIRTWIFFSLIALLSLLCIIGIGCLCCTIFSKKGNEETMNYQYSSSRASSVRSNSGRN